MPFNNLFFISASKTFYVSSSACLSLRLGGSKYVSVLLLGLETRQFAFEIDTSSEQERVEEVRILNFI